MPRASIVIPCYNAERYLRPTLESALAQTMPDLEVVCVNNNSTDGTRAILDEFAARDARVRVVDEAEPGEGPARDAGRELAAGEWLYFLDSDDLMEPQLLEEAIGAGEREDADVVVFRTRSLDDQTGEIMLLDWCWRAEWLPDGATRYVPAENARHALGSFQNWVHNKLFRGSFVRERGLVFQHVHRTADLLFTCRALTEARCVAVLDEPLHQYRVNNPGSAMATSDSYPLDFLEGFLALREELERQGTWELYRDSYLDWAIEGCVVNLDMANSLEGFRSIADALRNGGLKRLGILAMPREASLVPELWDRCQAIADNPLDQLLFDHFRRTKGLLAAERNNCSRFRMDIEFLNGEIAKCLRNVADLEELRDKLGADIAERDEVIARIDADLQARHADIDDLQQTIRNLERDRDAEIERLRSSTSFKVGSLVTAPARKARDLFSKK